MKSLGAHYLNSLLSKIFFDRFYWVTPSESFEPLKSCYIPFTEMLFLIAFDSAKQKANILILSVYIYNPCTDNSRFPFTIHFSSSFDDIVCHPLYLNGPSIPLCNRLCGQESGALNSSATCHWLPPSRKVLIAICTLFSANGNCTFLTYFIIY